MPEILTVPPDEELLTDDQACELLEFSYATLYNRLKYGPPTTRHTKVVDVRLADWVVRRGQRRWVKSSLLEILHGSREQ